MARELTLIHAAANISAQYHISVSQQPNEVERADKHWWSAALLARAHARGLVQTKSLASVLRAPGVRIGRCCSLEPSSRLKETISSQLLFALTPRSADRPGAGRATDQP